MALALHTLSAMQVRFLPRFKSFQLAIVVFAFCYAFLNAELSQATMPAPTCESAFSPVKSGPLLSLPERALRGFVAKQKEGYRSFRSELKEQGLKRLLIAPRDPAQKYTLFDVLTDPLFELPQVAIAKVREARGKMRPSKQLSRILTVPLTMIFFSTTTIATDLIQAHADEKIMTAAAQHDRPGAIYLEQLVAAEAVGLNTAADGLRVHERDFAARVNDQKPWPRIEDLKKKKLISESQAADLNRIVSETVRRLAVNGELPDGFDSTFRDALLQRVAGEPSLVSISPTGITSLSFVLWPEIKINKHQDLDLYLKLANSQAGAHAPRTPEDFAFAGLWEVADKHISDFGLGAFLKWTGEIEDHPEKIVAKQLEARRIGFPEAKIAVASRPDLPVFSRKFEFYDLQSGPHKLNSEMDRWNFILHDWRLQSVKRGWLQRGTPSLETLTSAEQMLRSLDQLFRMENPSRRPIDIKHLREPSESEILMLTGADGKHHENLLFSAVEANIKQFELKGEVAKSYRHYATTMYWNFFAEDSALVNQPVARAQHFQTYDAAETKLLDLAVTGEIVKRFPKPN
jgi:hypothetical protein